MPDSSVPPQAPPALEKALPTAYRRPKFRLEEMTKKEGGICTAVYAVVVVIGLVIWLATQAPLYNEARPVELAKGLAQDNSGWGEAATDNATSMAFADVNGVTTTARPRFTLAEDTLPMSFTFRVTDSDTITETVIPGVVFDEIVVGQQDRGSVTGNLVCKKGLCTFDTDLVYETWQSPEAVDHISFKLTMPNDPGVQEKIKRLDKVEVYVQSTNAAFEMRELLARYFLLIVATGIATRFYYKIAFGNLLYPWHAWALEQKWTFILLVLLIGFDNPFIVNKVYSGAATKALWMFIDIGLRYTFLLGYLLAVLSMTDHIAQSLLRTPRKNTMQFYRPKLALLVPLWVLLVGHLVTRDRPQMTITDPAIIAIAAIVMGVYAIWLFALISVMAHKVLTAERTENQQVSDRFQVLWTINVLMIVACAVCIYRTNSFGLQGWEFIITYAGFNLYVFVLATLFTPAISSMPYRPVRNIGPAQDGESLQENQAVVINDEYEVDDDY